MGSRSTFGHQAPVEQLQELAVPSVCLTKRKACSTTNRRRYHRQTWCRSSGSGPPIHASQRGEAVVADRAVARRETRMTVSVVCGAVRVCRLVQASTATWPYTGCGVVAERSGVPCVCGSRKHKRAHAVADDRDRNTVLGHRRTRGGRPGGPGSRPPAWPGRVGQPRSHCPEPPRDGVPPLTGARMSSGSAGWLPRWASQLQHPDAAHPAGALNCRPARAPPPTIDRPRRAPGDAGVEAGQPPDATHTCAPGWWPPVVVANGCHRLPTAGDPVLAGGFARTAAVAHSGPTCHRSRHHTYWASGGETPG